MKNLILFLSFTFLLPAQNAFAWGKRGHEIVASVAARLVEEKFDKKFLRGHEFDLGYYANVPDIIWKNLPKEQVDIESPQHFLDWTKAMADAFGSPMKLPLELSEFKARMGDHYKFVEGNAPWRIRGMVKRCQMLVSRLSKETQGPLLVCLGVLSHYTGDMGMPLHVSENYDGQMTNQKGIHAFFETTLVEALDPKLKAAVLKRASEKFEKSEFRHMNSDTAVRALISDSFKAVVPLLEKDKSVSREDIPAAAKKYKDMIVDRLAQASIATAVIWAEILKPVTSWDSQKFYFFDGAPQFIEPGKE